MSKEVLNISLTPPHGDYSSGPPLSLITLSLCMASPIESPPRRNNAIQQYVNVQIGCHPVVAYISWKPRIHISWWSSDQVYLWDSLLRKVTNKSGSWLRSALWSFHSLLLARVCSATAMVDVFAESAQFVGQICLNLCISDHRLWKWLDRQQQIRSFVDA